MKIALDAMGHDDGPAPLVEGAAMALREYPQISRLFLTGDTPQRGAHHSVGLDRSRGDELLATL